MARYVHPQFEHSSIEELANAHSNIGRELTNVCDDLEKLKGTLTIHLFESPERIDNSEVYHAKFGHLPFLGTSHRANVAIWDGFVLLAYFRKTKPLTKELIQAWSSSDLSKFWGPFFTEPVQYDPPKRLRMRVNPRVKDTSLNIPTERIERLFYVELSALRHEKPKGITESSSIIELLNATDDSPVEAGSLGRMELQH